MTIERQWLDVLLVVEDDKFLNRSKSGAIWGTVYFQIGESQFFPQKGWTDLVVAFAAGWLDGLRRVTQGISEKERAYFLDGPFALDLSMSQKGFLDLSFVHREKLQLSTGVEVEQLVAHSQEVARDLLSICDGRGWSNNDTEILASLVEKVR